jgi:K+-transporting ATPase ATPase C chain
MVLATAVLGVGYPLLMTGIARVADPGAADGSLVRLDGSVVGSRLVGQRFTSPAYFHGRPSATRPPDDPVITGGASLGPDESALRAALARRIRAALRLERPYAPGLTARDLPVDMVTTSGSGIDPDISRANALLQARRVAVVRGLPRARVVALIDGATEGPSLGFLGERGVNVLMLNLALDRVAGPPRRP